MNSIFKRIVAGKVLASLFIRSNCNNFMYILLRFNRANGCPGGFLAVNHSDWHETICQQLHIFAKQKSNWMACTLARISVLMIIMSCWAWERWPSDSNIGSNKRGTIRVKFSTMTLFRLGKPITERSYAVKNVHVYTFCCKRINQIAACLSVYEFVKIEHFHPR